MSTMKSKVTYRGPTRHAVEVAVRDYLVRSKIPNEQVNLEFIENGTMCIITFKKVVSAEKEGRHRSRFSAKKPKSPENQASSKGPKSTAPVEDNARG